MLGSMEVIRNEPSCSSASCHVHNKAQTVLGVLDINYSLGPIDRAMERNAITIAVFSLGSLYFGDLEAGFLGNCEAGIGVHGAPARLFDVGYP